MVHDNCSFLVINLGVNSGISDEIDDPFFTIILVQSQSCTQVLDINSLMNLAVALTDQMSSGLDKVFRGCDKEEIGTENFFSLGKFLLCFFKIKVEVQSLDEISDWVRILVVLLLDDTNDIFELLLVLASVAGTVAVGDNCSSQISKDPWAGGLDGVDECWGEEEIADNITSGFVVEEWEQSPVNEPGSVVKLCERFVEELCLDQFLDLLDFLHRGLPVSSQDLTSQFTPCCCSDLVVISREDSELIKKFGSCSVVSTTVLEITEVIQDVNHLNCDLFRC